jgi:predicted O-linked N-acetylglucosamine transferase (SPINDLY family)
MILKNSQGPRVDDALRQAAAAQAKGKLEEALNILVAASQQFPREPQVYLNLGNLLAHAGRWGQAERCYAAVCTLQPSHAVAQHNWGVTLLELSRAEDAIRAFERAIALNPKYASAYHSLGLSYLRIDALEAALLAFECATGLDGADARFRLEHARTLVKMGRSAEALAELEALAASSAPSAEVFNLQGIALKNLGRADEALAAYDRAIGLHPDFAEALNNRGNLRLLARRFSPAVEDFDRALALRPDLDWLTGTRLYAALHFFDWAGYEQQQARIVEGIAQQRRSIQPLALQCIADDPDLQQQAARRWTLATCPPGGASMPARAARATDKIRVAYVSRDFKSHPVSFLMAEVFELHDREQFEVIAINYGAASRDPMQERLRAAFDRFLDVEQLQDRQIAELARTLEVDIAVDLSGFTDGARSAIFAWRAAPIQVSYLGYLGTAGAPLYDYLIADRHTIPDEARRHYDERIIFLPSYQANDRRRPTPQPTASRASLGLPESGFVFCCFNNPCKITPAVFHSWTQILKEVPDAVLWVLGEDENAGARLRQHAQQAGIAPERMVFARRAAREEYLAQLSLADLFLDTLPYNAGTTASDALWMGLPVLTQAGRSFPGRVATSLLRATELPELVAPDPEAYRALAVKLAQQPALLSDIRGRLTAARREARLFDTPRFTRSLERAYREIRGIQAAGEPPRDISVID